MKKTCSNCRYFIKRWWGGIPNTRQISKYGYCQGNEKRDLMQKGVKYIGFVHKDSECLLPNIGKREDWKPIVKATAGMRKMLPYSMHPFSRNPRFKDNKYQREWQMEQEKLR